MATTESAVDYAALAQQIKDWGQELGFQQIGISDIQLGPHAEYLQAWLDKGYAGSMDYMHKHGDKRHQPESLIPGTLRVISARMNYWPPSREAVTVLRDPNAAYISRYALGRDYHKLMRKRLTKLCQQVEQYCQGGAYRAFVDSAPVLEKALAEKSGLGWIGKHTLLLNRQAGSYFFLGEIYTDLPLPPDATLPQSHCGSCRACIDICPTQAIIAPYELDARRCISYLTIESKAAIPVELRPLMGNRIFGCDDCQLFCPWNRFAQSTDEQDFHPRHQLDQRSLLALFAWSEETFLENTAGSPIRRTGYQGWLRNLAVALGNAPYDPEIIQALQQRDGQHGKLVDEHIGWAVQQQQAKARAL